LLCRERCVGRPFCFSYPLPIAFHIPCCRHHSRVLRGLTLLRFRYFARYTSPDFVQATLVGTEPAIKFDLYQKGVASLAADIFGDFKLDAAGAAGLAVPLLDDYELAFDVKKNVDAALASQESFAAVADRYNLSSYQVDY